MAIAKAGRATRYTAVSRLIYGALAIVATVMGCRSIPTIEPFDDIEAIAPPNTPIGAAAAIALRAEEYGRQARYIGMITETMIERGESDSARLLLDYLSSLARPELLSAADLADASLSLARDWTSLGEIERSFIAFDAFETRLESIEDDRVISRYILRAMALCLEILQEDEYTTRRFGDSSYSYSALLDQYILRALIFYDPVLRAETAIGISTLYAGIDNDQSGAILNHAIVAANAVDNRAIFMEISANIAKRYYHIDDIESTLRYARQAIETARELRSPVGEDAVGDEPIGVIARSFIAIDQPSLADEAIDIIVDPALKSFLQSELEWRYKSGELFEYVESRFAAGDLEGIEWIYDYLSDPNQADRFAAAIDNADRLIDDRSSPRQRAIIINYFIEKGMINQALSAIASPIDAEIAIPALINIARSEIALTQSQRGVIEEIANGSR